ncbi:hypothetical protein [Thermogutta sp.]|jgi:hypothetical protein|uniref:hypothetical protein n=1 Tax=Thermogutta sp. TaxID=1962930 RepID=UPI00321F811F
MVVIGLLLLQTVLVGTPDWVTIRNIPQPAKQWADASYYSWREYLRWRSRLNLRWSEEELKVALSWMQKRYPRHPALPAMQRAIAELRRSE